MAITYTTSASAVFAESLNLEMYGGSPVDDTTWLSGGSDISVVGAYPGAIEAFQAHNSVADEDKAVGGYKLVCGQLTTTLADDETITLTGDATKIVAVIVGNTSTAAAGVSLKNITAGVAQFTVVGTPDALVTLWMIVA